MDCELFVIQGQSQSEVFGRLAIHPRLSFTEKQAAFLIASWSKSRENWMEAVHKSHDEHDDVMFETASAALREVERAIPFREARVRQSVVYRCQGVRFVLTIRPMEHSWDVTLSPEPERAGHGYVPDPRD